MRPFASGSMYLAEDRIFLFGRCAGNSTTDICFLGDETHGDEHDHAFRVELWSTQLAGYGWEDCPAGSHLRRAAGQADPDFT